MLLARFEQASRCGVESDQLQSSHLERFNSMLCSLSQFAYLPLTTGDLAGFRWLLAYSQLIAAKQS
jgi:hypothetical protein